MVKATKIVPSQTVKNWVFETTIEKHRDIIEKSQDKFGRGFLVMIKIEGKISEGQDCDHGRSSTFSEYISDTSLHIYVHNANRFILLKDKNLT